MAGGDSMATGRRRLMLFPLMLIAGCSGANEAATENRQAAPAAQASIAESDPVFRSCGGELKRKDFEDFLIRLKKAIDEDYAITRHPELFSRNFTIMYRGKWIVVPAPDLANFRKPLSRKQDWDFIYKSLLAEHLDPVGSHGCMLDDGKIWFEADEQGRLAILSFSADLQWTWLRKPRRQ